MVSTQLMRIVAPALTPLAQPVVTFIARAVTTIKAAPFFLLGLSLLCPLSANADSLPFTETQAIRAIVGEAASEGFWGQLGVACALRNRKSLQGVYGLNAPHVDREPQWVWNQAERAWRESAGQDITGGATHWYSTDFPPPYWSKKLRQTCQIGKHRFFRK